MSRFFSGKYRDLSPYTPGEQPKDTEYIKLNTNESPFPPPKAVMDAARDAAAKLHLYPDPDCGELTQLLAEKYGVSESEIIVTNGSDEVLNFAFMAFCDAYHPAVFPNITYGFYPVFADLNGIPYEEIPLREDFTVNISDYIGIGKTIFLANPNAPTGLSLHRSAIERVIAGNPDSVVVVDEAYVDFGAESCVPLTRKYDNLLVTQTFSKSRSMAGARLGYGIGNSELIRDLQTIKYSTNPYNVDRLTAAAGAASVRCDAITEENCRTIIENREYTKSELYRLGFEMTDSAANFVFAKHKKIGGEALYLALKARGILVRHFDKALLCDYNRVTVGTMEQMKTLIFVLKEILEEAV